MKITSRHNKPNSLKPNTETTLKATREKRHVTNSETKIRVTAGLSEKKSNDKPVELPNSQWIKEEIK